MSPAPDSATAARGPDGQANTGLTRRQLLALGGAAPLAGAWITPGTARAAPVMALPAPRELDYELRLGRFGGSGLLSWSHDEGRYRARLEGRLAGWLLLQWVSEGAISPLGLAPERFVERRTAGREHSARFLRPEGVVRYSSSATVTAFPPDAQDRLSWMIQLAARANATGRPLVAGDTFSLWVTGARGHAQTWSLRCTEPALASPQTSGRGRDAAAAGVHLVREPQDANDTRVDVWLDPRRDHLPIRAVLASPGDGDSLELRLRAGP